MDDLSYTLPGILESIRHRMVIGAAISAATIVVAVLLRFV